MTQAKMSKTFPPNKGEYVCGEREEGREEESKETEGEREDKTRAAEHSATRMAESMEWETLGLVGASGSGQCTW